MAESNRGPWIIAGAILLAAALGVGAFFYARAQDQTCAEWQASFRAKAQALAQDPPSNIEELQERPELERQVAKDLLEASRMGARSRTSRGFW